MGSQVALLRAINVGGNKLPMADLRKMGEEAGLEEVSTYIASGNLIFRTDESPVEVRTALEARLQTFFGKPMDVLVRTAGSLSHLVATNPYPGEPGNRVAVVFLDGPPPEGLRPRVSGNEGERFEVAARELFIHYPAGMGRSKLVFGELGVATVRNMNTVRKLAEMAHELD